MTPQPIRFAIRAASFLTALFLLACASPLLAQGAPGFHIGVSGGAMIPVEDEADVFNVG